MAEGGTMENPKSGIRNGDTRCLDGMGLKSQTVFHTVRNQEGARSIGLQQLPDNLVNIR